MQVLSQAAFKRLKDESREKGARNVLSAMAAKLGVNVEYKTGMSLDEYRSAVEHAITERLSSSTQKPTGDRSRENPQQNANRNDRRGAERWEKERATVLKENEDLKRRLRASEEGRKEALKLADSRDAEMELRTAALMAGIKDPEFAIRLLTRELQGKTEEDLAKFDEGKFFEGLRSTRPYLFGEVVKPATTGNGAGGAPPTPKPGDATQGNVQANQVDARKMSKEEFMKHLQARGLSIS